MIFQALRGLLCHSRELIMWLRFCASIAAVECFRRTGGDKLLLCLQDALFVMIMFRYRLMPAVSESETPRTVNTA